jgi:SAM-dependent methyltransferase
MICPACEASPTSAVYVAKEMMMGLREAFSYRQCSRCQSLWLPNPPSDLARFYRDGYYSMNGDTDARSKVSRPHAVAVAGLLRVPARAIDQLSYLTQVKPEFVQWLAGIATPASKIADIGSGEGLLIRKMARYGFKNLWGVDPFIAGDVDDGPVHLRRAVIEDIEDTFDVVMLNHSLEHVPDPLATLEAVRQRLRTNGSAVVRIPVVAQAWQMYGTDWVGLDPPRHLTVPTEKGMRMLAERAGFSVVRVFYDSYALQFSASERYQRGVPLQSAAPPELATRERDMAKTWSKQSRRLNRQRRGDTAGFVLRPS